METPGRGHALVHGVPDAVSLYRRHNWLDGKSVVDRGVVSGLWKVSLLLTADECRYQTDWVFVCA